MKDEAREGPSSYLTDRPEQLMPIGWTQTTLGDVLESIIGGGTPSKNVPEYFEGDIPLMTVKDMRSPRPNKTGFNITQDALENSSAKLIPAHTVITATRMALGRVVRPVVDVAINQDLKALFPTAAITNDYLEKWLNASASMIETAGTGTTVKGIRLSKLRAFNLPLPPLSEQHRIVEKIDTLFADLDQGEAALQQTLTLLKRYRQSLLKAAVTGELTADWRKTHATSTETGQELLERILKVRREHWEAKQRAKFEAKGKIPKTDAWKKKYKEPAAPDTTDLPELPELPEGWVWATVEQLFDVYGGATPSRREAENWGGEIPWVSSGEVGFCRITNTNERITEKGYKSCSTRLHPPGTILLAMIGEGRTRGQSAILDISACNNQNAAAIRVSETSIPPEYVYYYLMGRYEQSRKEGQGGNQPALNGTKVKAFAMPVPSIQETAEIVERLESAFYAMTQLETHCQTELTRAKALRQSILKDAFAGKLVPQDPGDEPASDLLARFRAEREAGSARRGRIKAEAK